MLDFNKDVRELRQPSGPSLRADVIIAGTGAVGLVLGLALAEAGLSIVMAGRIDTRPLGRTVALLEGSVGLLARLGLWTQMLPHTAPLRVMRLVDDTGSLFRVPPVEFHAAELERDCFGHNIENVHLVQALAAAAEARPGLRRLDAHLAAFRFERGRVVAAADDGSTLAAPLLVAADGRHSPARRAARIGARQWRYPQVALTTILQHERPHGGVSTEFHTRAGPFTLVPLPQDPAGRLRSSLVWVMTPDDGRRRLDLAPEQLARAIERQSRLLLGGVTIEGPVGHFPLGGLASHRLTGPRIALAGEAAHAFPPIGAQGLNLGLRDVADLAARLAAAHRRGQDLGAPALLDDYGRARRQDVLMRTVGVDWLNRALLADWLPVDALRGAGLLALGSVGPLRRLVMRQGLMPQRSRA